MDKRHLKRIHTVQNLFILTFEGADKTFLSSSDPLALEIAGKIPEIDKIIRQYASRYPLDKIAKIDLSILRLSIYELLFYKKNPPKVIIDEAVTLAKEFGNEKSYAFINGVLASILKEV